MATIVESRQSFTGRTPFLYPALKNSDSRTKVALANRPVLLPSFLTTKLGDSMKNTDFTKNSLYIHINTYNPKHF